MAKSTKKTYRITLSKTSGAPLTHTHPEGASFDRETASRPLWPRRLPTTGAFPDSPFQK